MVGRGCGTDFQWRGSTNVKLVLPTLPISPSGVRLDTLPNRVVDIDRYNRQLYRVLSRLATGKGIERKDLAFFNVEDSGVPGTGHVRMIANANDGDTVTVTVD